MTIKNSHLKKRIAITLALCLAISLPLSGDVTANEASSTVEQTKKPLWLTKIEEAEQEQLKKAQEGNAKAQCRTGEVYLSGSTLGKNEKKGLGG